MTLHIYLADPNIRSEQLEAIRNYLPTGWLLSNNPAGATAILTENVDISTGMLTATGESLRLIVRLDIGQAAVTSTDVPTVNLPHTSLVGVAEHAVLLIMVLSRHLFWVTQQTAQQQWAAGRDEPILTDQQRYTYNWIDLQDFGTLYGKTAGLVGLGVIGRATAERLRALGLRLLYTKRNRLDPAEEAQLGVQWRELDDLLRESDFVSLHHRFQEGPDGNDKHIGAREFELMKPTAYLINTARGRLVDEDALVEAIRSGQIAGAGLDVFRYEPLPADHPLWELAGDKVILTPHIGGAPIAEAWQIVAEKLVEKISAVL
jgi:phosphoglycerate dehydrogenase-like enzyme